MRKRVAVDLDGVLADYAKGWQGTDAIGDPLPGAVEFTRQLAKFASVLIFTTRCKESLGPAGAGPDPDRRPARELRAVVKAWLDRHGFAYDDIYTGQGKPCAAAYVDDRAVPCEPQLFESAFASALARVSYLCGDH